MADLDPSLLAHLAIFQGLGLSDLQDIAASARSRQAIKGETIFEQGEEPSRFFVLMHGALQVTKATPDGQQVVVRYVSPGEIFGVAVAMGLTTSPATVTATIDSVVLVWPSSAWPTLVARAPGLALNVLQTVGARLQDAHTRVVEMSTEQVGRRIAHALLRLVRQSGRKVEGGIEIGFPISRQDVAEITGTTLHTVSRILSAWEKDGLVSSGRQRIVIRDPHRLLGLAEG